MIQCKTVDYQPGTVTRYILIYGFVTEPEDAMRLNCSVGSLYLSWMGHGTYTFSESTVPGYLAEKFGIQQYMLDAIALTQFVMSRLNEPMMTGIHVSDTDWNVCSRCTLPYLVRNENSKCYCEG